MILSRGREGGQAVTWHYSFSVTATAVLAALKFRVIDISGLKDY